MNDLTLNEFCLSVISNVPWNCRIHACKTTEIYRKMLPTEKNTIQNEKNIQQFKFFFNEICSLSKVTVNKNYFINNTVI